MIGSGRVWVRRLSIPCVTVGLLFMGLVLGGSRVVAQATETSTVTASITPAAFGGLYATGTAVPTLGEVICPGTTPDGFGTTTPGVLWESICADCFTIGGGVATGIATYDWGPFNTQAACQTVSPGGEECYWSTSTPVVASATATVGTPGTPSVTPTGGGPVCLVATATIVPASVTPTVTAESTWSGYLNDNHANVTYQAGWSSSACGICVMGGDQYASSTTNSYFEVLFSGAGFRMYSVKGPSFGIFEFYVDDISQGTVDLYASSWTNSAQVKEWTGGFGVHTVKVRVTGTKNGSSSGYTIQFDAWKYLWVTSTPTAAPGVLYCNGCTGSGTTHLRFEGTGQWTANFGISPSNVSTQITFVVHQVHQELYSTSQNRVDDDLLMSSAGGFNSSFVNIESWCLSGYGTDVTCEAWYRDTVTVTQNTGWSAGYIILRTQYAPDWPSDDGVYDWEVDIYRGVECVQWGTATPAPGQGGYPGYCGSIVGAADSGFSYTGITYGDIECLDLGPLDWADILPIWMGPVAEILPSIPWIAHVCFQDMDIGSATIFGGTVYLSAIAFVAGIIAIVALAVGIQNSSD